MDEQECIRRCQAGDWRDFEPIFRAHIQMAIWTAFLITRDWSTAEDAAQEAFIRAYRSIKSFKLGSPFAPWLCRIVVNEARRVAERKRPVPAPSDVSFDLSPEVALLARERRAEVWRAEVWRAVHRLGEEHRLVLILKYFRGFSELEIASVLDLKQSTVKSRLYVARQRLMSLLGRAEGVEA